MDLINAIELYRIIDGVAYLNVSALLEASNIENLDIRDLTHLRDTVNARLNDESGVAYSLLNPLDVIDTADRGGIDDTINIAAGAVVELKVGSLPKQYRKYIQIQAKDKDITWGFGSLSQNFDAFKNQFFILPFGENTSIYLKNNGGSPAAVAIAEIS